MGRFAATKQHVPVHAHPARRRSLQARLSKRSHTDFHAQAASVTQLRTMAKTSTQRKRKACSSLRELLRENHLEIPTFRGELSKSAFEAQRQRLLACALSLRDTEKLEEAYQAYQAQARVDCWPWLQSIQGLYLMLTVDHIDNCRTHHGEEVFPFYLDSLHHSIPSFYVDRTLFAAAQDVPLAAPAAPEPPNGGARTWGCKHTSPCL